MARGERDFETKFSVVQECPRCRQLSLSFRQGTIICSNCGYEEKIPTAR